MVSAQVGWGLAQGSVLRTTDGWRTATTVTPTGLRCVGGGMQCLSSAFLDGSHAWVMPSFIYGAKAHAVSIFRTADGGRRWKRSLLAPPQLAESISAMTFADPLHGWLQVAYGPGAGQLPFILYATSDGGARWSLVSRSDMHPTAHSLPSCDCYNGIVFSSARTGWATGRYFASNFGQPFFYRSEDGGRSWAPRVLPPPHLDGNPYPVTYPPTFFSASDAVMPMLITTQKGSLVLEYATHNGGTVWHHTAAVTLKAADVISSFASMSAGFVLNGHEMARTTDGGRHWTTLRISGAANLAQIDFVSTSVGYGVQFPASGAGPLPLLITTDGGRNWAPA
jgi:photosystem II stability/assembly factor-like uncharacterized protein